MRRIDRFAIIRQVHDAARFLVQHAALGVVFSRLRHVDLIRHAVDHVEVVRWEVIVNQFLSFRLGRIDLVELPGRPFEPFLQLSAGHQHGIHRVGIQVQVGHVLDGDVACRNVGVVVRALASAGFKRGSSRQHGHAFIFCALQMLLYVPFLRIGHDLDRGIVLDQSEPAIDRRAGFADRSTDILQRVLVILLDCIPNRWVRVHQRLLIHGVEDGLYGHFGVLHRPGIAGSLQRQVDDSEVVAPIPRFDGRYAVDRAFGQVDARLTFKRGIREYLMRVAEQDRVDAFYLAQVQDRVLHQRRLRDVLEAGVRHRDDEVGAFFFHLRHKFLRRFHDILRDQLPFEMRLVPG
ncbi:hypothetical protein D3C81_1241440 [compost metagenome]